MLLFFVNRHAVQRSLFKHNPSVQFEIFATLFDQPRRRYPAIQHVLCHDFVLFLSPLSSAIVKPALNRIKLPAYHLVQILLRQHVQRAQHGQFFPRHVPLLLATLQFPALDDANFQIVFFLLQRRGEKNPERAAAHDDVKFSFSFSFVFFNRRRRFHKLSHTPRFSFAALYPLPNTIDSFQTVHGRLPTRAERFFSSFVFCCPPRGYLLRDAFRRFR